MRATRQPTSKASLASAAMLWSHRSAVSSLPSWSGASYAAVPFYQLVLPCHRLQRHHAGRDLGAGVVCERRIAVRFDANVSGGSAWKFEPEQTEISVKIGEVVSRLLHRAPNPGRARPPALAAYNVAPLTVGAFFQKINCFCFTEQTFGPGEKREMAVVFYVDPALVADHEYDDLNTITLSYTFYPAKDPRRSRCGDGAGQAQGQSLIFG